MVKQSNYVLVVWNGKSGGAGKILSIARTLGKIMILINANTFEVRTDSNKHYRHSPMNRIGAPTGKSAFMKFVVPDTNLSIMEGMLGREPGR